MPSPKPVKDGIPRTKTAYRCVRRQAELRRNGHTCRSEFLSLWMHRRGAWKANSTLHGEAASFFKSSQLNRRQLYLYFLPNAQPNAQAKTKINTSNKPNTKTNIHTHSPDLSKHQLTQSNPTQPNPTKMNSKLLKLNTYLPKLNTNLTF